MALHVRLLGPVTARVEDREVDLGGPLPRGALAVLALEAPTPVAPERLVAALWGEAPPASARDTLRSHLSRLRGSVGAAHLERSPAGYRLRDHELDVDRFGRLARAGRAALDEERLDEAVASLAEAVGCWDGPALADLSRLPFAARAAARLEEQRLQAEEDLLDARLRAGGHLAALDALQRLHDAHPLRERLTGLLMLALYRGGRQVDALSTYSRLRGRLVESAGLEPGAEVAELHRRILAQDPALVPRSAPPRTQPALPAAGQRSPAPAEPPPAEPPPPRPDSAPPAPTPPARRRVPVPLSSFVGRAEELATAQALREAGRLVTLTGMGGCGKTRLALELARRAAAAEETCVVELAGLDDGAHVPSAVADALGVRVMSGQAAAGALIEAIGPRPLLLVLDNCEHVITEVALLTEELLRHCPALRVLATSREPLGVAGERVMVVPSLTIADGDAPGDAVLLFAERAAQVDPTFALTEANAALVARICAELDGIPLAIELAAARLGVLAPAQLAAMLDDRFAVLTSGSRTALPRHRTLEATVAWSHELLTEEERQLFAAASVFRGGFDHEALAAVAGGAGTLDVLGRLVAKSMLVVERAGATRRYRMLVTLREYAQRGLDDGRRRALADAHARWAADFLAEAEQHLRRPASARWWARIATELHNLRAALQHALETEQVELALRLAGPLGFHWYRNGPVPEGLRWLRAALELAGDAHPGLRSKVRLTLGMASFFVGDLEGIAENLRSAVEGAEAGDDPEVGVLALLYLAYFEASFTSSEEARTTLERAEALVDRTPAWVWPEVLMTRAQLTRVGGDPAGAEALLLEARRLALDLGHGWCAGQCGWIAAMGRLAEGRPGEAVGLLAEVVGEFAAQDDRTSTLSSLHTMAAVLAAVGYSEQGAELLGAVEAIGERVGYAPTRFDLFNNGYREAVARRLPQAAFDAAVARGRSLELGAAVDLAVRLAGEATSAA